MISQVNNRAVLNGLNNKVSANKENTQKEGVNVSSQDNLSKVQQIKNAIASGEYKVDLEALSEKMAEELL
jgi:flagellar biosynthesis anti-sigma factor FlgM